MRSKDPSRIASACAALSATLFVLAACGGSDGASGPPGHSALIALQGESAGANCAYGGTRIEAGRDLDDNGKLDANEVVASSTQYLCNGGPGAQGGTGATGPTGPSGPSGAGGTPSTGPTGPQGPSGANVLVRMSDVAAGSGSPCPAGGKLIEAWFDSIANQSLDSGERSSSAYLCNASDGTPGPDGANSMASSEPVAIGSADCPTGGLRFTVWLETSGDHLPSAGEAQSSYVVCSGTAGKPALRWQSVTAASVQTVANTGYIAANDGTQVAALLPLSNTLAIGDAVLVSGAGQAGWKLAQNSGQVVYAQHFFWTTAAPRRNWRSVAISPDGSKLVASGLPTNGDLAAPLDISLDGGRSWLESNALGAFPSADWGAVVASDDASFLAVNNDDQTLYRWTAGTPQWTATSATANWRHLVASKDFRLAALSYDGGAAPGAQWILHVSGDQGSSWNSTAVPGVPDADDAILSVAWLGSTAGTDSLVVSIKNSGIRIVDYDVAGNSASLSGMLKDWGSSNFVSVASSQDAAGTIVAADARALYRSVDRGLTWTTLDHTIVDPGDQWRSVAVSRDGRFLVAGTGGSTFNEDANASINPLHVSSDGGLSWQLLQDAKGAWNAIAMSQDARRLVALGNDFPIFLGSSRTTPGADGSIEGNASSSIELQYVGRDPASNLDAFVLLNDIGPLGLR